MKRTQYIYKLPWPGRVTFRICCGSWRGGFWGAGRGSGGIGHMGARKGFFFLQAHHKIFNPYRSY